MGRVVGVGGVFLRSADPARLAAWYGEHLGLELNDWGGAALEGAGTTAWSAFPADSDHLGPASQAVMVNYRVEDLPGLLAALEAAGVWVDPERPSDENGSFAWIRDCDGNRVELWEAAG